MHEGSAIEEKSVARQIKLLRFGWNPGHALAFEELKTAIARSVKLVYPRDDMVQCVSLMQIKTAHLEW